MTRDEQRMVWRTYAAAALVALDVTKDGFGEICDVAEEMLNREMERFEGPDHSGDADKKVEPKPWVSLTVIERIKLRGWFNRHESATLDDLLIHHDELLREKNGGTR